MQNSSVARTDIPAVCERLRALLAQSDQETAPVICDVSRLLRADAVTGDALARLQLTARRHGRRVQLRQASAELQALLTLMGLSEIVPLEPVFSIEPQRQVEEREQLRGIQEECDSPDPSLH